MTIKIALLGFGTVASGLPKVLAENYEKISGLLGDQLEIGKVLVRNQEKQEQLASGNYPYDFVTEIDEILADDSLQVVVELMGRIEPAKTYISQAMKAGKHVVTANKDLIALHGAELIALAEEQGVGFYYEAAVAGGIPILRTLATALAGDKIERILGVLNGTSNFMLTKMIEDNWTYEEALAQAQALGYAESDPTNDVEGIDAAYKAAILTQFGFGMTLDFAQVSHQGISTISKLDVAAAKALGYGIKLIGDIRQLATGLTVSVAPSLVPLTHPLAGVNGVMNAIFVQSFSLGQTMYYGAGAGQLPTALSVLADLLELGQVIQGKKTLQPFNPYRQPSRLAEKTDVLDSHYVLLKETDVTAFDQLNLSSQSMQVEGHQAYLTRPISRSELLETLAQAGIAPVNIFKVLGD